MRPNRKEMDFKVELSVVGIAAKVAKMGNDMKIKRSSEIFLRL